MCVDGKNEYLLKINTIFSDHIDTNDGLRDRVNNRVRIRFRIRVTDRSRCDIAVTSL